MSLPIEFKISPVDISDKKEQLKTFAELPSLYVFLCLAPPFATHTHARMHLMSLRQDYAAVDPGS